VIRSFQAKKTHFGSFAILKNSSLVFSLWNQWKAWQAAIRFTLPFASDVASAQPFTEWNNGLSRKSISAAERIWSLGSTANIGHWRPSNNSFEEMPVPEPISAIFQEESMEQFLRIKEIISSG
jgi:hypothetical protein